MLLGHGKVGRVLWGICGIFFFDISYSVVSSGGKILFLAFWFGFFGSGLPRGWKNWNFGKNVQYAVLWDGGRDIYEFSSIEASLGGV